MGQTTSRSVAVARVVLAVAALMVTLYSLLTVMTLFDGRPIAAFGGPGVGLGRALAGVLAFALAVAALAFIYGLARKRAWARPAGIAVFVAAAAGLMASGSAGVSPMALLIPIAICGAATWTLVSPEMRAELDTRGASVTPSDDAARPLAQERPGVATKSLG